MWRLCLAIVMRNSSKIHCARSISRQRTTTWTAESPTLDHAGDGLALDFVKFGTVPRRLSVRYPNRGRLMAKYPYSVVAVKDLQSGKAIAVDHKLDLRR